MTRAGRLVRGGWRVEGGGIRSLHPPPSTLLALLLLAAPAALRAQFPPEVRGRVVERATGAPVAGARVEAVGGAERVVADAGGAFALRGLEPGARVLRVTALGFRPEQLRVEVANGRVTRVAVALSPVAVSLGTVRVTAPADAPRAGATVIGRPDIERSAARELGELLQGEAGLVVTRRGGAGSPATVSVRGSSAAQVLVLLDGVPLNDALTGAADLSLVPLGAVERVTVLRGAESARYGGGALGGVVAVETRQPRRPELAARASAGSYGQRAAAATAAHVVRHGRGALSGLVAAERQVAANDFPFARPVFRGGGTDVRLNADAASTSVLATALVERHGAEGRLRAEALDVERGMPGFAAQQSALARQTQRRVGAVAAGRVTRGAWQVGADAALQQQRARYHDPAPATGAAYDDTARVTSARVAADAGVVGARAAAAGGVELRALRFRITSLAASAPDEQRVAAAWASGRLWRDLGPAGGARPARAELFGGARADRASLGGGTAVSPRAGVSVARGRLAGRVAWGRAFSPPSLADQFFQEGVLTRPNPALAPERVRGETEAGLELRAVPAGVAELDADVAVYRADVEGMILWSPNFRFEWSPQNVDVRRRGADASARARLAVRGRPELRASASWTAVEYAGPVLAGQVAFRPRVTASAGVAARLPGGVDADLSGRYAGRRRTDAGTSLNPLPAYRVADLRLSRGLRLGAWRGTLSLGIADLFDEQPALLVDYPSPGRSWTLGLQLRLPDGRARIPAGDP